MSRNGQLFMKRTIPFSGYDTVYTYHICIYTYIFNTHYTFSLYLCTALQISNNRASHWPARITCTRAKINAYAPGRVFVPRRHKRTYRCRLFIIIYFSFQPRCSGATGPVLATAPVSQRCTAVYAGNTEIVRTAAERT